MKITAFHLAGKVEEAVRSYFSNSFVFSSRRTEVERVVDFRKGSASVAFFVLDGPERVPMGGLEISTIQEKDGKVAFQCKSTILPSGESEKFFMILPEDVEQYSQYTKLASVLSNKWDKAMDAYLPRHEEAPAQATEGPQSLEDEYASLSPEEIEAITGVKPEPKAPVGAAASGGPSAGAGDDIPAPDAASEEEIQRLMGMMMSGEQPVPGAKKEEPAMMSMEEIEALAREVSGGQNEAGDASAANQASTASAASAASTAEDDAMSAEDIWKQINSGK